jgi:hypothetical protein
MGGAAAAVTAATDGVAAAPTIAFLGARLCGFVTGTDGSAGAPAAGADAAGAARLGAAGIAKAEGADEAVAVLTMLRPFDRTADAGLERTSDAPTVWDVASTGSSKTSMASSARRESITAPCLVFLGTRGDAATVAAAWRKPPTTFVGLNFFETLWIPQFVARHERSERKRRTACGRAGTPCAWCSTRLQLCCYT